jgi:hypothetical protein
MLLMLPTRPPSQLTINDGYCYLALSSTVDGHHHHGVGTLWFINGHKQGSCINRVADGGAVLKPNGDSVVCRKR